MPRRDTGEGKNLTAPTDGFSSRPPEFCRCYTCGLAMDPRAELVLEDEQGHAVLVIIDTTQPLPGEGMVWS